MRMLGRDFCVSFLGWNWNNFIFRKTNWLYRHIYLKWGILVQYCSNEGAAHPSFLVLFLELWPLFLSGVLHSKHQLAALLLFLPALCCNLKQVIAFSPGKNRICIVSCILSSPHLFPHSSSVNPVYKFDKCVSGHFRHQP